MATVGHIGFRVWGIIRVYGLGLRAGSFKQHRFCCSRCEEGQFEVKRGSLPAPSVFWLDRPPSRQTSERRLMI